MMVSDLPWVYRRYIYEVYVKSNASVRITKKILKLSKWLFSIILRHIHSQSLCTVCSAPSLSWRWWRYPRRRQSLSPRTRSSWTSWTSGCGLQAPFFRFRNKKKLAGAKSGKIDWYGRTYMPMTPRQPWTMAVEGTADLTHSGQSSLPGPNH